MLEIYERLTSALGLDVYGEIELCHLQREKGRFKTTISTGETVGIFLERGKILKVSDALISRCGRVILVTAKKRKLSQPRQIIGISLVRLVTILATDM